MAADFTRRTFLKATTAATAATYAARAIPAWAADGRGSMAITLRWRPFPMPTWNCWLAP